MLKEYASKLHYADNPIITLSSNNTPIQLPPTDVQRIAESVCKENLVNETKDFTTLIDQVCYISPQIERHPMKLHASLKIETDPTIISRNRQRWQSYCHPENKLQRKELSCRMDPPIFSSNQLDHSYNTKLSLRIEET